MKRIIVFLTLSFLALSCGTEELAVEYAPENNLVSNTALREKVMRVAQHPTVADDFIDLCSCFSIKMPYTVYVNNDVVYVESEADYQQVYDILHQSDYDYDGITFLYPITVVYADYHEEELDIFEYMDAVETCNGAPAEIACAGFEYPVGIKTYNSQNTLAQSFEVGDKEALYDFLATVDGYDAAALTYPLYFVTPNGSTVAVSDNSVLEQQIDSSIPECDAEYYEEPELVLAEVLDNGNWGIAYFFNEGDVTSAYSQYIFIFNPDMSMIVTGNFPASDGYWDTYATVSQPALTLYSFTDSYLSALEESWLLTEITETDVYFFTPSDGVTPQKYLQLTKL